MNTISIGSLWKFSWGTFIKRPWFLIGVTAILFILTGALDKLSEFETAGILALAFLFVNAFIELWRTAFFLRAEADVMQVKLRDGWMPSAYWRFLGVIILLFLAIGVGLILLIVPGLIAMAAFLFAPMLVIDRKLGPIEALKESAHITRGSRWQIVLLILIVILLNIAGLLLLGVGILVAAPISSLMIMHAYRTLASKSGEVFVDAH